MKKNLVALMCAGALMSSMLVACGSDTAETQTAEQTTEQTADASAEQAEATTNVAAEGELLTGLGTSVSIADSTSATADEDGQVQVDATIAAVTVDSNGAIVECTIDIAQTRIGISADGKILSDLNADYPSKRELGDEYGMKKASAIGKEWYEQADGFAEWVVGKTASDISGMAISEGYAGDEDLAASVSIHVTGFQAAVLEAMNNATAGGAVAGDKLGLGVTTNIANSVDASDDGDGTAEAYTTISVVTVGTDGKISSSILDAVQAKVTFDATGTITADTTADVPSKVELGDAYGMKQASAIGKEWFEQAAAYAEYSIGKTADEVNATPAEEGKATDTDLAASVSVHITDFNKAITKAVASAQ